LVITQFTGAINYHIMLQCQELLE